MEYLISDILIDRRPDGSVTVKASNLLVQGTRAEVDEWLAVLNGAKVYRKTEVGGDTQIEASPSQP